MQKIIGFDIDDTLTNLQESGWEYSKLQEWLNLESVNLGNYIGIINRKTPTFEERYPGLSYFTLKRFNNWYFPQIVKEGPFRKGVKELFEHLHTQGYLVYIITRRDDNYEGEYSGKMMRQDTIDRFDSLGIKYDKIFFSCFNKLKTMKENNVNILVEDSPMNIYQCASHYPVIIMDSSYNESMIGKNMYHIKDFNIDGFMNLLKSINI